MAKTKNLKDTFSSKVSVVSRSSCLSVGFGLNKLVFTELIVHNGVGLDLDTAAPFPNSTAQTLVSNQDIGALPARLHMGCVGFIFA